MYHQPTLKFKIPSLLIVMIIKDKAVLKFSVSNRQNCINCNMYS